MLMLHFRLYRRGLTTFVINNRLRIQAELLVLEKALSCCGLLELHAMNRYQLEGQAELGTVISAMRPSLDNWTRVDCCIARSILNFFHVAYSGAFPSYCHILLRSYVNASFLFSYKMKWFTYHLTHGRSQDFFSGGGTLFQKKFQKIFQKILKKIFKKFSKKYTKKILKKFKKNSKIFKKILENFEKFS